MCVAAENPAGPVLLAVCDRPGGYVPGHAQPARVQAVDQANEALGS